MCYFNLLNFIFPAVNTLKKNEKEKGCLSAQLSYDGRQP
jgi:hypothetical protein